ncbi:MAG: hypothetical protein LC687_06590 [Actinobacteria bacterium]|nr:hypothetical protein [Actinomycetota bacterium]
MKTLKIDDKFSIVYDDENNDRPVYVERYSSRHANINTGTPNWIVAMFYTLLEQEQNAQLITEANQKISDLQNELSWANEPTCY